MQLNKADGLSFGFGGAEKKNGSAKTCVAGGDEIGIWENVSK